MALQIDTPVLQSQSISTTPVIEWHLICSGGVRRFNSVAVFVKPIGSIKSWFSLEFLQILPPERNAFGTDKTIGDYTSVSDLNCESAPENRVCMLI